MKLLFSSLATITVIMTLLVNAALALAPATSALTTNDAVPARLEQSR